MTYYLCVEVAQFILYFCLVNTYIYDYLYLFNYSCILTNTRVLMLLLSKLLYKN